MMRYHTTLSKKAFMKLLGFGENSDAIGIVSSLYRDLDEVKSSPAAERKLPGWIKEVEKPTVEIDWDMITPFDGNDVMWVPSAFERAWGKTKADWFIKLQAANQIKWAKENKPGYTLRDWALSHSLYLTGYIGMTGFQSFLGPRTSPTPESLGFPRWPQLPWWLPFMELVWFISLMFLPLSLTIAVMRFRLYDIDIIINRTLVYGMLTAIVVA